MAHLNVKDRVLETKIVYYGAGLSGKTTNLEQIKALAGDGRVGELMSLNTDGDRTLFFDYLPLSIGKVGGRDVKVQLYTVPGQPQYAETRRRVLAGADGIVLVLDSDAGALDRNRQTVADLREHMRENGIAAESVRLLVQLNKRDVPNALAIEALLDAVGMNGSPHVAAVAVKGEGVMETLREATRLVLELVKEQSRAGTEIARGATSKLDGNSTYTELLDAGVDAKTGLLVPVAKVPEPPPRAVARPAPRAMGVADPTAPLASGTHVNAGGDYGDDTALALKSMMRRLDGLTASLPQMIAQQFAMFERTFAARVVEAVQGAMLASMQKSMDKLAGDLEQRVEGLRADYAAHEGLLEKRSEDQAAKQAQQLGRVGDVLNARINDIATVQSAARTAQQNATAEITNALERGLQEYTAGIASVRSEQVARLDTLAKTVERSSERQAADLRNILAEVSGLLSTDRDARRQAQQITDQRINKSLEGLQTQLVESKDRTNHVFTQLQQLQQERPLSDKRLSKQVTDDTAQLATVIELNATSLGHQLAEQQSALKTSLQESVTQTGESINQVREMVDGIVRAMNDPEARKRGWFR